MYKSTNCGRNERKGHCADCNYGMLLEGAAVLSGFQKCLVISEDFAYSRILGWSIESYRKVTGKSLVKVTRSWEISVPKANKSYNSKDWTTPYRTLVK